MEFWYFFSVMGQHVNVVGTLRVMVNFTCQLDGAMGCLDIWSNMILGVPVRTFKLTFEIGIPSKAEGPP